MLASKLYKSIQAFLNTIILSNVHHCDNTLFCAQVLRRFYDLNGYDPAPLYGIDETLQQHIAQHGLLPLPGPGAPSQQAQTTCLITQSNAGSSGPPVAGTGTTVVPHPGASLSHPAHALGLGAHPQLLAVRPSTSAAIPLDDIHMQQSAHPSHQHLTQSHIIQLG